MAESDRAECTALQRSHADAIEAHRRAPTLMAGVEPASHGEVQIWIPNRRRMRKELLIAGFVTCLGLLLASGPPGIHGTKIVGSLYSMFGIGLMLRPIKCLRRPRYLTTDALGAGITTSTGTRAIAWNDINFLQRVFGSFNLGLRDGTTVLVRLEGFTRDEQAALQNQIVERANLRQYPDEVESWFSHPRIRTLPLRSESERGCHSEFDK